MPADRSLVMPRLVPCLVPLSTKAVPRVQERTSGRMGGALVSLVAHAGILGALSLAVFPPLRGDPASDHPVALVFAAPPAALQPVPVPMQVPVPVPVPTPLLLPVPPPSMRETPPAAAEAAHPAAPDTAPDTAPDAARSKAVAHAVAPPRLHHALRSVSAATHTPLERATAAVPAPPAPAALAGPPSAPAPALDLAGLKILIQRAVQDAAVYPPRARMMHREGRAQVRFDYVSGTVAAVALAQSSQSPMLDEAALEAVRRAAYPKAAVPTRLALSVWVHFGTAAE